MKKLCLECGQEKEDVGPKVIGQVNSVDPRLVSQKDALLTKVMCEECLEKLKKG